MEGRCYRQKLGKGLSPIAILHQIEGTEKGYWLMIRIVFSMPDNLQKVVLLHVVDKELHMIHRNSPI